MVSCVFSPQSELTPLRVALKHNISSSSRHPDDLYKNGIQRTSFLPAIELLKTQFDVTDLDSGTGPLFAARTLFSLPFSRINTSMLQTIAAYPALSHMPTFHH